MAASVVTALGNKHGKHPSACPHLILALFNCTHTPALHEQLKEAGVVAALQPFTESKDARVQDAARGCLLELGALRDSVAEAALLQSAVQGSEAAPGGASGPPGSRPQIQYEVFLSHKRTDAKDFARALYNLLVLRGFSTFLDFEFREDLNQLSDVVSNCANLIFILTDNVFESTWCMRELEAASTHG